jgi:hypothetical protein
MARQKFAAVLVVSICVFGVTQVGTAQDPTAPQLWEAFGQNGRALYVEGFKQGSILTYGKSVAPNGGSFSLPPWAEIANSVQVSVVMSDLYRDPSNVNINPPLLVWVARDKLLGKDVSEQLRAARADAAKDGIAR